MKLKKVQTFFTFMHKIKKISLISLVSLWLIYVASINHAANQSFEIDNFKQDIKDLEHDILILNVEATRLQTTERIENVSKSLSFVQTEDIYYLNDEKNTMALR